MGNAVLRLKWTLDPRCVRSLQVLDQNHRGTVVVLLDLLIVNDNVNKCGDSLKKQGNKQVSTTELDRDENRFTVFISFTVAPLRLCRSTTGLFVFPPHGTVSTRFTFSIRYLILHCKYSSSSVQLVIVMLHKLL